MDDDILNIELDEEQAKKLTEFLENWKQEVEEEYSDKTNNAIEEKLDELEELNGEWREKIAEEYSDKFLDLINDIKKETKAEAIAEAAELDPYHIAMENIMKQCAPMMNEDYVSNTYLSELKALKEKNDKYEKEKELAEGAKTLDELIEGYDESYRPAIKAIIGEGTSEEIEDRFLKIMKSANINSEEDDLDLDEDEDFEDDYFDDLDEDIFNEDEEDFEDDDFDDFEDVNEDEDFGIFEDEPAPKRSSLLKYIK